MEQPGVEPVQLVLVEFRRGAAELREIEFGDELGKIGARFDRIGGAELGQQAVDRHGLDPLAAQMGQRQTPEALRQPAALSVGQQRQMGEGRHDAAERLENLNLGRGIRDVIVAPDDVGDAAGDVVHHRRKRVKRLAVGADHDGIGKAGGVDVEIAVDQIDPGDLLGRQPEAPIDFPAFGFQFMRGRHR